MTALAYCVDSGFVCLKKKKKITTNCAFSGSGLGISRKNRKNDSGDTFEVSLLIKMIFLFFVCFFGVRSVYVEFTVYYISI